MTAQEQQSYYPKCTRLSYADCVRHNLSPSWFRGNGIITADQYAELNSVDDIRTIDTIHAAINTEIGEQIGLSLRLDTIPRGGRPDVYNIEVTCSEDNVHIGYDVWSKKWYVSYSYQDFPGDRWEPPSWDEKDVGETLKLSELESLIAEAVGKSNPEPDYDPIFEKDYDLVASR